MPEHPLIFKALCAGLGGCLLLGDWAVDLAVPGYSGFADQCNRGGREHDPRFRPCGSIELGSGAPVQFYLLVKAGGHL